MPPQVQRKFKITDPKTSKTFRISWDGPNTPTDDDIDEMLGNNKKPDPYKYNLKSVTKPIQTGESTFESRAREATPSLEAKNLLEVGPAFDTNEPYWKSIPKYAARLADEYTGGLGEHIYKTGRQTVSDLIDASKAPLSEQYPLARRAAGKGLLGLSGVDYDKIEEDISKSRYGAALGNVAVPAALGVLLHGVGGKKGGLTERVPSDLLPKESPINVVPPVTDPRRLLSAPVEKPGFISHPSGKVGIAADLDTPETLRALDRNIDPNTIAPLPKGEKVFSGGSPIRRATVGNPSRANAIPPIDTLPTVDTSIIDSRRETGLMRTGVSEPIVEQPVRPTNLSELNAATKKVMSDHRSGLIDLETFNQRLRDLKTVSEDLRRGAQRTAPPVEPIPEQPFISSSEAELGNVSPDQGIYADVGSEMPEGIRQVGSGTTIPRKPNLWKRMMGTPEEGMVDWSGFNKKNKTRPSQKSWEEMRAIVKREVDKLPPEPTKEASIERAKSKVQEYFKRFGGSEEGSTPIFNPEEQVKAAKAVTKKAKEAIEKLRGLGGEPPESYSPPRSMGIGVREDRPYSLVAKGDRTVPVKINKEGEVVPKGKRTVYVTPEVASAIANRKISNLLKPADWLENDPLMAHVPESLRPEAPNVTALRNLSERPKGPKAVQEIIDQAEAERRWWGKEPKIVEGGEGKKYKSSKLDYPPEKILPSAKPRPHITERLGKEEFTTQQGRTLPKVEFPEFMKEPTEPKVEPTLKAKEEPKSFKDVSAIGANLRSHHKILMENPETAPVAEHLVDAYDKKIPWIRATLEDAAPHIEGLGKKARIELGKALDSGDFSKLSPDMQKRAAGLKKVFEDIHKKFPAGKNVGQITNYYTHMGEYSDPGLLRSFADLFKKEDISIPKNPPGIGNLYQTGLGTPSSPYVKLRTGALKDIDFDIKRVLPKYTESVAKVIFDEPAVTKSKKILETLPESKIKDLTGWAIRNASGFSGEPSLGAKFSKFANKAKDRTARAFVDWNVPLHMLHLGELPVTVLPELGAKYTAHGVKKVISSPVKTWKKTSKLGLIQGDVKPLAFKTVGDKYASAAQFFNAVERFVKGSTYEGALKKFLDEGHAPDVAAQKALRLTKDVTLDTGGPRKAKGLFGESNIAGGEVSSNLGSQFKGVPLKIAEQMYDVAESAKKNPGKAAKMLAGSIAMMYATKQGAHTFHLNPASLIKTTAFGAFGTAMAQISNALYKGDYETAIERMIEWNTPGGQHIVRPAYEALTNKKRRDKNKQEQMTKESKLSHPPMNSIRRAVDYMFKED